MDIKKEPISFVTLGMFIIDEFSFMYEDGRPTGQTLASQECPSRKSSPHCVADAKFIHRLEEVEHMLPLVLVYGFVASSIMLDKLPLMLNFVSRLPPSEIGMIVDKGDDFPEKIKQSLVEYGRDMWLFREQAEAKTTRALNSYRGEHRG